MAEVETIIWLNEHLKEDRKGAKRNGFLFSSENILVPEGQRTGGVPKPIYDEFSTGSERACADIVVTTHFPDGTPAVLAIKRNKNQPFHGKWWMQGGSYHTYRLISDFVAERAEKECGVRPEIEGKIGQFRTCAGDYVCSTTNLCYVGYAPYDTIMKARTDKDHTSWRLFTLQDIISFSATSENWHWYPLLAFKQALTTMPLSKMEYDVRMRIAHQPELLDEIRDRIQHDDVVK